MHFAHDMQGRLELFSIQSIVTIFVELLKQLIQIGRSTMTTKTVPVAFGTAFTSLFSKAAAPTTALFAITLMAMALFASTVPFAHRFAKFGPFTIA